MREPGTSSSLACGPIGPCSTGGDGAGDGATDGDGDGDGATDGIGAGGVGSDGRACRSTAATRVGAGLGARVSALPRLPFFSLSACGRACFFLAIAGGVATRTQASASMTVRIMPRYKASPVPSVKRGPAKGSDGLQRRASSTAGAAGLQCDKRCGMHARQLGGQR